MSNTIKVRNTTDSNLQIPGHPAFGPKEVREVGVQYSERLLMSPYIEKVTKSDSKSTQKAERSVQGVDSESGKKL